MELTPSKKPEYLFKLHELSTEKNRRTQELYTLSRLTEKLSGYKTTPQTREFLKSLENEGVLVEERVTGEPPNQVSLYRIDREGLLEFFWETRFCQESLDLMVDVIQSEWRGYTVDRKIELPSFLGRKYELTLRK